MQRKLLAGLLAFGFVACSGGGSKDAAGNDGSSNGGVGSGTAAAPASGAAAISASTASTLAAGTTIEATIQDPISSRTNTTGEHVKAIVSRNVVDGGGRIVIPGGAAIVLTIAQLRSPNKSGTADGVVMLDVTSMSVGGMTYEPSASVGTVPHTLSAGAMPADRDVIVTPGTPITIRLTQPLKISAN